MISMMPVTPMMHDGQSMIAWFPPGLEKPENLEDGKEFSSQGILSRLEKSGKSERILLKILEKSEKVVLGN